MSITGEAAVDDGRLVFLTAALAAIVMALTLWSPARPAEAGSLRLTWNECALSGAAATNVSSACSSPDGVQRLYAAFRLDTPLDSVVAVEVTVDVQHAFATLPEWWRFAPGDCRAGSLRASAEFSPSGACADFWVGRATKDPPVTYLAGTPGGAANRARMLVGIALPPDQPVRLEAGVTYYAAEITISNLGTLGCGGCSGAACLVLNSVLIGRLPSAPGGNFVVEAPASTDNWATWQGGAGASCAAVPAARTSWGRIKGLYR